jgi:UPF0755 protein
MGKYKPVKPKKKSPAKGKKVFTILIILLIIAGFIASLWFVLQILNPVKLDSPSFSISQGQGVNQISLNLAEQGIIRNPFAFELYVFLKGIQSEFKAGDYDLPSVVNMKRLTEILTQGQPVEEWRLQVIEGLTIKDIAFILENKGKFQAEELMEATGVGQPSNQFSFNISNYDFLEDKPASAHLEGYLFPDTYRFFTYSTINDIVRKMLNNFDKKLTSQMRQDIQEQDKTIFDIITMASIIEREVMSDADRAIVSGIFWKRLDIGMPLQADSTINYVTGKKTPAVSAEDLEIDSLYNTYRYPGLTPGPISNPGISSIKAAIYPEESDYWYFLTDQDGNVHYAEDFEGHKQNKAEYL